MSAINISLSTLSQRRKPKRPCIYGVYTSRIAEGYSLNILLTYERHQLKYLTSMV